MAKSLVTDAGTLFIPGAYSKYSVQTANAGLATTGVLMLVGEADAGPDYSLEEELEDNAFGPDQLTAVIAKYKGGPIVDAFRAACSPANDPDITGSFSRAVIVKTNVSTKASGALPAIGGGDYGTLYDKSYGRNGNLIRYQTTEYQAEAVPTTGSFTFIPPAGTVNQNLRVNGGAALSGDVAAACTPATFVSTLDALSGVSATGGAARTTAQSGVGTLAVAVVSGNSITITYSGTFTTTPSVGDTVVIPPGSVIDDATVGNGAGDDANVGGYVVTAATSSVITCTKLSDAGKTQGGAASPGTITAPAAIAAQAVSGTVANDIVVYGPVTITLEAADVVSGRGKSLEIGELATGTDLLSRCCFELGTTTAVDWVSTAAEPALLTSEDEYRVKLTASRTSDAISEESIAGGEIAMKLGYDGTTATVTITDDGLTTSVAGGTGSNLDLLFSDYATIQELVDYINVQSGYTASAGTAALGHLPTSALDNVSAQGICTEHGEKPGRIKIDAYRFFNAIEENSLVQLGEEAEQAESGLPDEMDAAEFLSGGEKGATTDAEVVAAIDALALVRGNFLIPLFSRDAEDDIADDLTDEDSTYTIDAIHAAARSHVLAMSTYKRRKNRQAILSIAGEFDDQKETAANIASFRSAMTFQDFKQLGGDGSVTQFLPWMGAVLAGSMQAAGFYRNIEFKGINTSGVLHREGDFSDRDDTLMEEALQAGLLPARKAPTGGFVFVSDQTTYGKDSNFVFNSLQAVYAADIVSLTTAQRMEQAFVGQSVADISAPVALSYLEGILADMLRLKLIAPSDDAAKGFKNARIQISGNAMLVSVEIKLATAIDFITIDFLVSPVQQTAG